jgi:hypothetical protein
VKKEAQYLLIAIVLTLAQVTGLVYVAAQNHFSTAYANFCRWDCVNYARIADEGMPTDIDDPDSWPVKYGFFPGLPVMAKIVMTLTNLERQKATVLTSQLFTVSFCFYVLALLGMLELTLSQSLLAVGFLLSFPTAFFLVAGGCNPPSATCFKSVS